ncbi:ABC transporter permease [Streptomyces sp. KE1]|uniref:ABC transporter permease n=1 Tax=Streptomyces sp. KE1 TaxID=1638939 RepID=UPI00099C5F9C|nr:ABC transporter permease [Streptomyces sp. KE1]
MNHPAYSGSTVSRTRVEQAHPTDTGTQPRLRRELRAVRVLWQREMIRLFRSRARLLMTLLTPLLFLCVLGIGMGRMVDPDSPGSYLAYVFPGALLMAVQMPALGIGSSLVWDREVGFLREMLVAPVRRSTLLVGKCMGGATAAAAQGAILLIFAGVAGVPYHPWLFVLLFLQLLLISMTLAALGALVAVWIKRMETFQTVLGLITMPLFFLSGALFTTDGLPGWLHTLTLVNPLSYAVDALRRTTQSFMSEAPLSAGLTWNGVQPPVLLELLVMCVLGAAALALAARGFARAAE